VATDEELVRDTRRGKMVAFDELYRRYSRRLFGYVRRYVPEREAAEDLLQDVFLAVLRDRSFDLSHGSVRGLALHRGAQPLSDPPPGPPTGGRETRAIEADQSLTEAAGPQQSPTELEPRR